MNLLIVNGHLIDPSEGQNSGKNLLIESGKVSAWLGEKMAELKLRFDDPAGGSLLIFESLEALSIGIEGKRLLFRAMAIIAEHDTRLRETDFDYFIKRAEEQREMVEQLRISAAKKTFVDQ